MKIYRHESALEPLLPSGSEKELSELTLKVHTEAGRLQEAVPSPVTGQSLRALVRIMNCYYSNLMEGHQTLPADIERALSGDYQTNPGRRRLQMEARAHVEVQQELDARLENEPDLNLFDLKLLQKMHFDFLSRMPAEMRWVENQKGERSPVLPGQWRDHEVTVGRHLAPAASELGRFLDRFYAFYGGARILPHRRLAAIAAAHHRLLWIHPFADGNGRVVRLFSHACLWQTDVGSHGLWSISRGLARNQAEYYRLLQEADWEKPHDFDGRGNLSDRALGNFCLFFLDCARDQLRFMREKFTFDRLEEQLVQLLGGEFKFSERTRERFVRLYLEIFRRGQINRGEAGVIFNTGATQTSQLLREALQTGLFASPSPKGFLRIAFPIRYLHALFPELFPRSVLEKNARH